MLPEKLVIEQADLYAAVDNSCDIFQRGIPVRGHRLRRFLAPQQEVTPVVECLVHEIPIDAVTEKPYWRVSLLTFMSENWEVLSS